MSSLQVYEATIPDGGCVGLSGFYDATKDLITWLWVDIGNKAALVSLLGFPFPGP